MAGLRFQVLTLPNAPWKEFADRFRVLEDLDFDVAAIADHFVDWTNPPSPWLESWTLLAAVARETSRIRLCTCVSQIPLREPAMFARQALTLDHVSGGRLDVGLGLGLPIDPSYDMMGIANWSNPERAARFREYIVIVDRLLSNEVSSFEGRYYRIKEAIMNPRPIQRPRPPLLIAAMGPRMLEQAAEHADIWNSLSFAETFEAQLAETRERIDRVNAHCAAIDRDPERIIFSYQMFDPAARTSGGFFNYYESPERFREMAERLLPLGLSELGLYYPMREEQLPVFERIAQDVLPELRERHGRTSGD